jgi:hypothetical protein
MQTSYSTQNTFGDRYDREVECPWCESKNTKLVSPFGPSVAEMTFKCNDCENSFGWLKWEHRLPE